MKPFFFHSSLLILSFAAVFLWQKMGMADLAPVAIGVLSILYLVFAFRQRGKSPHRHTATIVLLVTMTLLLIATTGGFSSLLFFLLYFLSFSVAFTLVPESVFVFAGLVLLTFLPESMTGSLIPNFLKLASFILLCPLAYFFGKEIRFREKEARHLKEIERDAEDAADTIIKDVSDILVHEQGRMPEQDLNKLADIVRQTRRLEKNIKT